MSADVLRLLDKAQRINPVYLRVRALNRPVSGIMLCDYSTKAFSLRAGQHVVVLDNAFITPVNSSSDETSESTGSTDCSQCCPRRHAECAECGNPLTTTTTTTTTSTNEIDSSSTVVDHQWVDNERVHGGVDDVSESSTATTSSDSGTQMCSHTLCSHRETLMWKIRTLDGSLEVDVPAVTVMINEADEEAICHANE